MVGRLSLLLLLVSNLALSEPCPDGPAEWKSWVKGQADALRSEGFSNSSLRYQAARMNACAASAPACASRVKEFLENVTLTDKPGHSMALTMTDAEYHVTPHPGMLDLPAALKDPKFLKLLDENTPTALKDALLHVEKSNKDWIPFLYDSQHLPTPDPSNALGRFFVFVPGNDFDQFLQFGLQHRPGGDKAINLSIVVVQKTDASGAPLEIPRTRLTDLRRRRVGGKIEIVSRLEATGGLENCYDCHKQGLLPITPDPDTFDRKTFGERLAIVNKKMSAFRAPVQDGVPTHAYGPGLGTKGPRTDAFFDSCAGPHGIPRERYPELKRAMNCTSCHNGKDRGTLNFPSGLRLMPVGGASLPGFYVARHEKMPPGAELSKDERRALVACLKKELYQDTLPSWLAHEDCWNQ